MSQYSWHPSSRPPPPEASLSARIALLGPVGKCLETALGELLAEDEQPSNENITTDTNAHRPLTGGGIDPGSRGENNEDGIRKALKPPNDSTGRFTATDSDQPNNDGESSKPESSCTMKMNGELSKSILDSYGNAVASTIFDPRQKFDSSSSIPLVHARSSLSSQKTPVHGNKNVAPTAIIRGELDHYNRVGGQWRLVIRNAILKKRKVVKIDNGMKGRSKRSRTILDWGDDGANSGVQTTSSLSCEYKSSRKDDEGLNDEESDVGIDGTVQILAYDDDV